MIGPVVLFVAAFVTAAAAALGFPSRTGTEGCTARVVSSKTAVRTSTNAYRQAVAVRTQKSAHAALTARSSC